MKTTKGKILNKNNTYNGNTCTNKASPGEILVYVIYCISPDYALCVRNMYIKEAAKYSHCKCCLQCFTFYHLLPPLSLLNKNK